MLMLLMSLLSMLLFDFDRNTDDHRASTNSNVHNEQDNTEQLYFHHFEFQLSSMMYNEYQFVLNPELYFDEDLDQRDLFDYNNNILSFDYRICLLHHNF